MCEERIHCDKPLQVAPNLYRAYDVGRKETNNKEYVPTTFRLDTVSKSPHESDNRIRKGFPGGKN